MRIGAVELGVRPCIIAAGGEAEVEALAAAEGADVVELRADLFDDPTLERVVAALGRLRAGGRPILLTARAASEGGRAIPDRHRCAIYEAGLDLVDAIDVEIASTELAAALVPAARRAGCTIVLSTHDFAATPARTTLLARVERAFEAGADIAKVATHAPSLTDLQVLIDVTRGVAPRPIATLAMGPMGPLSRFVLAAAGSLLTYASVGAPTAPGQMPLAELSTLVRRLFPEVTVRAAVFVLAVGLALPTIVFGQSASTTTTTVGATTTTTAVSEEDEELDLSFTSPRSAVRGFLVASRAGDYRKAAEYLDLRALPKNRREADGPLLARQLRTILDRTLIIDVGQLSDSPEGDRDDGLPPRRDRIGTIKTSKGNVDVVLERVPLPDGGSGWKIASSVVALIPLLYADFGDGPFASYLPDFMLEVTILQLRLWQWIGVLVLLGLGGLLGWLTTGPMLRLLAVVVPEDRRHQSGRLLGSLKAPLRVLVTLVVFTAGQRWLALGITAADWVTLVRKTLTTIALTWLWLRVVDVVGAIVDDRLRIHGRAGAVGIVPLLRRTIKIFVAAIAVIVVVQNLGYDATGILAGLGVGGLALALAAQKTVENLFGGVMVIADQPVRVGDLCRFGSRVGTVEEIGFRSTRVRTPERSLVSIPNAEFSSTQIENLSVRDRMLLQATFGVKVGTPTAALRKLLPGLRGVLEHASRVDPASISVRVVGLSVTSIDVEVVAYFQTRDWNEFLAIREDAFLAMLDVFDAAGLGLTERQGPPAPATPPRA